MRQNERDFLYRRFGVADDPPSNPASGLAGWDDDGVFVGADSNDLPFRANQQPLTQRDLKLLREGQRSEDAIKLYTDTLLETVDQHTGRAPDLVIDGAVVYKVLTVKVWGTEHHIPHSEVVAIRTDEAESVAIDRTTDEFRLIQAVRDLFLLRGLENAQVIVGDDNAPRPPLPYLDVRVTAYDLDDLTADDCEEWSMVDADTVGETVRAVRSARVSVRGYGGQAAQWMGETARTVARDAALAAMESRGAAVVDVSAITNISIGLDTAIARRWEHEWLLTYEPSGVLSTAPGLEILQFDTTGTSTSGAPPLTSTTFDPPE